MTRNERQEYRNEVVELFRESGMSQKAFAESYGIARSTLGIWIRRIKEETTEQSPGCIPVGTIGERHENRGIRITTSGGVTVEMDLPATEEEIAMVLRAVSTV